MPTPWYYDMDAEGETPMSRAFKSGHALLTQLLVLQEEENVPAAFDDTSLYSAAYWGHGTAVRKLLDSAQQRPPQAAGVGEPLLHLAARHGHLDTIRALVERGTAVNETADTGVTALHWVALNGHCDIAEYLIRHGIDISTPASAVGGLTPLAVAKLMGYEELFDLLIAHGARY